MGGSEQEVALLVELLHVPERRVDALWALGFSGRLSAAEACLEWMEDAKMARLADELPEELPPLEEDLKVDLIPRPEDELPRPDAEAVATWWRKSKGGFERGVRYLMGSPFQAQVLFAALEQGPMRRRPVWARELAIRSRGAVHVSTRALTGRQRKELSRARRLDLHLPASPFTRWLTW